MSAGKLTPSEHGARVAADQYAAYLANAYDSEPAYSEMTWAEWAECVRYWEMRIGSASELFDYDNAADVASAVAAYLDTVDSYVGGAQ